MPQEFFSRDINTNYGLNTLPIMLYGSNSYENSLYNIALCPVNSLAWEREYGSYLMYYLQQPMGIETAYDIRASLIESYKRWEPRVTILESTSVRPYRQSSYAITVMYEIRVTKVIAAFQFQSPEKS